MSNENMTLEVVNPNAAGIDIGSRSHWVACRTKCRRSKRIRRL